MPNATEVQRVFVQPEHVNRTPLSALGRRYAIIPRRLLVLPAGELKVLAALLALRGKRGGAALALSFEDLHHSTGYCGRRLDDHLASLRARGLVEATVIRASAEALRRGRHYAKVPVGNLAALTASRLKTLAIVELFTERRGRRARRTVTFAWIVEELASWTGFVGGRSLRTLAVHVAALRALGFHVAERHRPRGKNLHALRKEPAPGQAATLSPSEKDCQKGDKSLSGKATASLEAARAEVRRLARMMDARAGLA